MNTDSLQKILTQFVLDAAAYELEPIHHGLINDTYLVTKEGLPLYVLQRINHEVFKSIDQLMQNIDSALSYLGSSDYAPLEIVKTIHGKTYYTKNQMYWRLITYIEDSTTYNTTTDTTIAFETGRIIGRFHHLLKSANTTSFVDSIPQFHDLQLREKQFQTALKNALPKKQKLAKDAILFAKNSIPNFKEIPKKLLPIRVCHNDTKLNNILFSKKDHKALCLIDLDTIMNGYFYYDFGDAIRTLANAAREDETDLAKITFNIDLFQSFVKGLASIPAFLKQVEIENLAIGAVYMPFIHGLRALTDYLNNNAYYKVTYENQNLDRCLSLFRFSALAQEQIPVMQTILLKNVFSD